MRWKWRIIWLTGLLLLWLLCSGVSGIGEAAALSLAAQNASMPSGLPSGLAERLAQYPDWQSKPATQPAHGDLVYPDWFSGDWVVTTTLVDLTAPLAPILTTPGFESNRQFLDQPIRFSVRFVETTVETAPKSWLRHFATLASLTDSPKQLVADRAYNGAQLAKAYLGERAVQAVKVDPTNPNRQITLLRGDRQLVSTVVSRATEAPNPNQFITSELFRQEFRGTPQVYFNEVENTTAYTHQSASANPDTPEVIADQVTAIYLSPQDPDYFKTLASDNPLSAPRPVALYRYRMEFRRP